MNTSYTSHLLVRYPRNNLKTERERLGKEVDSRLQIVERYFAEAIRCEDDGLHEESFDNINQALNLLESPAPHASSESLRRIQLLKRPVVEMACRLSSELGRIAVEPVSVSDELGNNIRQDPILTEALTRVLLDKGFRAEKPGTDSQTIAPPKVVAFCRDEGADRLEDGFCFSRWTAAISLQDPRDNSVIFSELFTAKGFGPDEKRAAMDAQRKLKLEAFTQFARLARDKFDMSIEEY